MSPNSDPPPLLRQVPFIFFLLPPLPKIPRSKNPGMEQKHNTKKIYTNRYYFMFFYKCLNLYKNADFFINKNYLNLLFNVPKSLSCKLSSFPGRS